MADQNSGKILEFLSERFTIKKEELTGTALSGFMVSNQNIDKN